MAVTLVGPAGAGKSWNLEKLVHASSLQCAVVRATDPVGTLIGLLPSPRREASAVSALLQRAQRGSHVPVDQFLPAFIRRCSALAPFVLVVEDLHEASDQQLIWWADLAGAFQRTPGVALLTSSRSKPPAPFESVSVPALDERGVRLLLQQVAGGTMPEQAVRWMQHRTDGNPLYLLEFFRLLTRQGELWSDGQRWHWRQPQQYRLPPTLAALIGQQLQHAVTTPDQAAVLTVNAILSEELPVLLRAKIAEITLEAYTHAESALIGRGILTSSGFAHPLFKEVAREETEPALLRTYARTAIKLLEVDRPHLTVELLPAAGLSIVQEVNLLLRAADQLDRQGEGIPAARLRAQAAMIEATPSESRVELALRAATSLKTVDTLATTRLVDLILSLSPDRSDAVFLKSELLRAAGRSDEAQRLLLTLPEHLRDTTWILNRLYALDRPKDVSSLLEVWAAHPEVQELGGVPLVQHVASTLARLARFDEAAVLLEEWRIRPDLAPIDQGRLHATTGMLSYYQGDYLGAAASFSQAVAVLKSAGDESDELVRVLRNQALVLWGLSRHVEACTCLETASRLSSDRGDLLGLSDLQAVLGAVLIELGEYERAEDLLNESLATLASTTFTDLLSITHVNLAYLYLEWAPPYGGVLMLRHARAGVDVARQVQSPTLLTQALVFAALAEGRYGSPATAQVLAEETLALSTQIGQRRSVALAEYAVATVHEIHGRTDLAVQGYQTAVEIMQAIGLQFWSERFGVELDRLQARPDRTAERVAYFQQFGLQDGVNAANRAFPHLDTSPARHTGVPECTLRVLGPVDLLYPDGHPLALQGRQAKMLLALLLDGRISGSREVSTIDLIDHLYQGKAEEEAIGCLHQLVYRIRGRAGPATIIRSSGGYALGNVASDAEAFLATGNPDLWRGTFLQGSDMNALPIEGTREVLRMALLERFTQEPSIEDPLLGSLCQIALALNPYDLRALKIVLGALRSAGQDRRAAKLHARALIHFAEVGESLPASWKAVL